MIVFIVLFICMEYMKLFFGDVLLIGYNVLFELNFLTFS